MRRSHLAEGFLRCLSGKSPQGIYYALEEGQTLETPGVRLPSVKEFFTDLMELNAIIHSGAVCRTEPSVEVKRYVERGHPFHYF